MVVLAFAFFDQMTMEGVVNLNIWSSAFAFGFIWLTADLAIDLKTYISKKTIITKDENGQDVVHTYREKKYTIIKNCLFKILKSILLYSILIYLYAIVFRYWFNLINPGEYDSDTKIITKFTGPTVLYAVYRLVCAVEGTFNAVNVKRLILGKYKEAIDVTGLVWTWLVFVFKVVQGSLIGANLNVYYYLEYTWAKALIPFLIVWILIHVLIFVFPFFSIKFSKDMGELLEFLVGIDDTQKFANVN